jgi:hypothetical protein
MRIGLILLAALAFAGCSKGVKTVSPGEYFTLKSGESVRVNNADIRVKMLENGTSQRPSGDSVFCKIEVTYKGKTEEKTLEVGSFASYNEWNLRLEKSNPGLDVTKTSCVLVVAKTLG